MKSGKTKKEPLPEKDPAKSSASSLAKCNNNAQRVKAVTEWIIDGHSMADIDEALNAYSKEAAKKKKLLLEVMTYFKNSGQSDPDTIRGWCLECLRNSYQKMINIGDYANAIKAVKQIEQIAKQIQKDATPREE